MGVVQGDDSQIKFGLHYGLRADAAAMLCQRAGQPLVGSGRIDQCLEKRHPVAL